MQEMDDYLKKMGATDSSLNRYIAIICTPAPCSFDLSCVWYRMLCDALPVLIDIATQAHLHIVHACNKMEHRLLCI